VGDALGGDRCATFGGDRTLLTNGWRTFGGDEEKGTLGGELALLGLDRFSF
jgi:hypothetical protein